VDKTPNPSEAELSRLQKPLEMFRARTRRLRIHPQEKLLLAIVSVHLVILPWALGDMYLWTQWISVALSALSVAVALIPRNYTEDQAGQTSFRLVMWPKLTKFPVFWLGLVFLAYVICQGLNPAWKFVQNERGVWWMQRIACCEWLPAGVRVPFERGGPWACLLVYATVWLSVCSLWIGVTRRRSLQFLFMVIAANGMALALFGLLQRLLGNGKIFGFFNSPNPSFFSSFIYKNHAGAYLNLTLFVSCGIAGWYYLRGLRRLEKSNPAGIFVFFTTFIAINVLISFSRGATMVMLLFLAGAIAGFVYQQLTAPSGLRRPIVLITLIVFFGFFLKTGLEALNTGPAWTRFAAAFSSEDLSAKSRALATTASMEMLRDHWLTGSGAGSYVFLFTSYQQHYPDLWSYNGTRLLWEHAHNDLVEFPIELGLLGMLPLLGVALYFVARLVRSFFWYNPLSTCVVYGLMLTLGHARYEFVFQNPAILLTFCLMLVAATQFNEFEEATGKI
jgi:hypothetical protein